MPLKWCFALGLVGRRKQCWGCTGAHHRGFHTWPSSACLSASHEHQRLVVPIDWASKSHPGKRGACSPQPAPREARGAPEMWSAARLPPVPAAARRQGHSSRVSQQPCVLWQTAFVKAGKTLYKMLTALQAQRGLRGYRNLLPANLMQVLSAPLAELLPDQGCAGLGGWVTAAATAAWIWQPSFGRNYKETLCPAAKKPDKNL